MKPLPNYWKVEPLKGDTIEQLRKKENIVLAEDRRLQRENLSGNITNKDFKKQVAPVHHQWDIIQAKIQEKKKELE